MVCGASFCQLDRQADDRCVEESGTESPTGLSRDPAGFLNLLITFEHLPWDCHSLTLDLYQIWLFVAPASYNTNQRHHGVFCFPTVFLFLAESAFGYSFSCRMSCVS